MRKLKKVNMQLLSYKTNKSAKGCKYFVVKY